jgi:Zn-finger nucleic acid-binding protein
MRIIACQECKRQWDVSRYDVGQKLRCVCNFVMQVPPVQSYTPEVNHCEACGAARASASREPCRYCGAVPTLDASNLSLVCPFCMHRTAKGSRFCSCCGRAIQAGKLDAKTGKLICPRCPGTKLMSRKVGDFAVDECPSCSGMWIEAGAFDRIVNQQAKRQDKQYRSGVAHGRPVRSELGSQSVVYLKCPVCSRHMHRRNFARASGVIVDECKKDGVWLDADELGKIADFVATGGLAFARERQEMDSAQAAPTPYTPIPALSKFPPIKVEETPLDAVIGVIRALFGSV